MTKKEYIEKIKNSLIKTNQYTIVASIVKDFLTILEEEDEIAVLEFTSSLIEILLSRLKKDCNIANIYYNKYKGRFHYPINLSEYYHSLMRSFEKNKEK